MNLEVVEVLALAGEGASSQHWSRNAARPRYSLTKKEFEEARLRNRFTCFDVAEHVEGDHDILIAGRSNGAVVLWRMVPRNLFGGANKNDRIEEALCTSSPHKGSVNCITHTRPGTYGSLGGPLVFSGSTDHTIKAWNAWAGQSSKETCLQTMAEHRGGVTALAFAGDSTLISTSRDGSIRLWFPQRGRKLLRFPFFCCVKCLSPYPVLGGAVARPIGAGHPGAFVDVWSTAACVAGGKDWTVYCGDSDGTVSVFQRTSTSAIERAANAGKRTDRLTMQQLGDADITLRRRWCHLHSLAVTGLALVPEHNFLLSMGNDGVCRILDYLQGKTFMKIECEGHNVFTSVAWDLAHELLVIADETGDVQIWNTYTGSLLLREKVAKQITASGPRRGHASPALLGFHSSKADGVLYGMSPSSGCFFQWKLVKVEGPTFLGHHQESIVGLGFQGAAVTSRQASSRTGKDRNTTTIEATAAEYKLQNGKLVEETLAIPEAAGIRVRGEDKLSAHSSAAGSGAHGFGGGGVAEESGEAAGFGLLVLSASVDGTITAWETVGKSEKYKMHHPQGEEVTSMLVLPGGSVLATGTDDGSVRFWRLETGAGESIKAHENTVSALASFRDRQGSLVLASGGFEGAIVVWKADIKDGLRRDMIPAVDFTFQDAHGAANGSDCEVLCLAFVVADAPLLVSGGNDLVVKCWRFRDHALTLLATLEGHTDSIESLIVDGLYVLSGGCDGTVQVWNLSGLALEEPSGTAASMVVFEAHPHGVAAMAVMNRTDKMRIAGVANLRHGEGFGGGRDLGEVGGLLITCAKEESVVKIWDYTHVEGDGTCGRPITEIHSPDELLFNCIACIQEADGEPLLFAGSSGGSIIQLAMDT